jgi:hypothetical protein
MQEEDLHTDSPMDWLTHVLYAVTENSCNDCELQAAAMEGEGSSERLAGGA